MKGARGEDVMNRGGRERLLFRSPLSHLKVVASTFEYAERRSLAVRSPLYVV
jgi:hypothetical protein